MKDTEKKHNVNNIVSWISIFILLASAIAIIFDYMDLKVPTMQVTTVFIAEIVIVVVSMLVMLLDAIQRELYDIKNSLDDLYDIKQINDLRLTVNKRHIEKLLNDIWENNIWIGGKINEKSKD